MTTKSNKPQLKSSVSSIAASGISKMAAVARAARATLFCKCRLCSRISWFYLPFDLQYVVHQAL